MKCHSAASLWPSSPPSHPVTAVLATSSSLFAASATGAIAHFHLSPTVSPASLLCGHASPIVALAALSSGHLLSLCSASVICLWEPPPALRCCRRRRLPPWAGNPLRFSVLPPSRVIVVCATSRFSRFNIVVLDARTLNVAQATALGGLYVGTPITVGFLGHSAGSTDVLLVDGLGRMQVVAVGGGPSTVEEDGESTNDSLSPRSRSSDASVDGSEARVEMAAVSEDGKIVGLVARCTCLFKCLSDFSTIGEISLVDSEVCREEGWAAGGCFISSSETVAWEGTSVCTVRSFVVWSSNGAAIVYRVVMSDAMFEFDTLCYIPAIEGMHGGGSSFHFCTSEHRLVRVESHSLAIKGSLLSKPIVSLWILDQSSASDDNAISNPYLCKLLGQGSFHNGQFHVEPTHNITTGFLENNGQDDNEGTVSASMVLSEDSYAPYAVIYGYHNGEIEVFRFVNLFPETSSGGSPRYPHIAERFFSGHAGAILCLAVHHMHAMPDERRFGRALISGSMDCTVRVWNLDTGDVLSVMRQHVAPVKQIILPPPETLNPWNDCFLSVGDDECVTLVSLESMRVERMFPGHPSYPLMVAWDGVRGYVACMCRNMHSTDAGNELYIWDVKTGARERIVHGTASQSVFDHFCAGIHKNAATGGILGGTTSASSLLLSAFMEKHLSKQPALKNGNTKASTTHHGTRADAPAVAVTGQVRKGKENVHSSINDNHDVSLGHPRKNSSFQKIRRSNKLPIKCFCPYPGISILKFDLSIIMAPHGIQNKGWQVQSDISLRISTEASPRGISYDDCEVKELDSPSRESLDGRLLRFSLCFLHIWDVDQKLDKLLIDEMQVCKPDGCSIAAGVVGDRGSFTLLFPGKDVTLELWKSSAEFCAMRSLTIVSLAQHMITLSRSCVTASSALAAFYTRNFAELVPDIKPPSLQLLVSFWQHPSEHVRMAARSLFHCAAPRAVPIHLRAKKSGTLNSPSSLHDKEVVEHLLSETNKSRLAGDTEAKIYNGSHDGESIEMMNSWLESFENEEWVSWIGGNTQDARASKIIVAAALVVWYPSIVKAKLADLIARQLIKLVMSMNDRYSSTAAELLAEGMESTWQVCLGGDIAQIIGDVFFQIECLSGKPAKSVISSSATAVNIRDALVGILLPNLAMADVPGFFKVVESQIWGTSSDSPVHLVSLKTIIRLVRGSPKLLTLHLHKVVNYVLHTMDPSNLILRKACLSTSMIALREIARVFPMVDLNESLKRLAIGDAIGDIQNSTIIVYDVESITKIRILDASGPPGLPNLIEAASSVKTSFVISALCFSPDGEGLVAFSENGLVIRWWSLGIAWWEKLSRNLVPVQCTKLIFVNPSEGFSPSSSRLSIMSSISGHDMQGNAHGDTGQHDEADTIKILANNLDLSYQLQWVSPRTVKLIRHGQELAAFQL